MFPGLAEPLEYRDFRAHLVDRVFLARRASRGVAVGRVTTPNPTLLNKANHGDAYYIAASPSFRSRACWLAFNGKGFGFWGGCVPVALVPGWVAKPA